LPNFPEECRQGGLLPALSFYLPIFCFLVDFALSRTGEHLSFNFGIFSDHGNFGNS
jgi:hypothetical protein